MDEKKEEKKYLKAFLKEDLNERLVNTVMIENHFKRRTSKEILRRIKKNLLTRKKIISFI